MKRYLFFTATIALALALTAANNHLRGPWFIAAAFALLAVWLTVVTLGVTFLSLCFFVDAVTRLDTDERVIALTYDDGPDPQATRALLDLLDELSVQAAFFCIGEKVRAHPDVAREIVKRGHLLAMHGERHHWRSAFRLGAFWRRDIRACRDAIVEATGRTPALYRPPFGFTNPHLPGVLRRAGWTCVGWTIRSLDGVNLSIDRVVRRVTQRLRPGAIVLLHDGGREPQRVLTITRRIVQAARESGYRCVRLDAAPPVERGEKPQVI